MAEDFPLDPERSIKRECGECSVCCFVSEVYFTDSFKLPFSNCKHCVKSTAGSCALFNNPARPEICRTFECSWKRGFGTDSILNRPDNSGLMVSINTMNGGTWAFGFELKENALLTTGKPIALHVVNNVNFPLIIVDHGVFPPNDIGNRVVIKNSLLHKSGSLIKDLIGYLDDEDTIGVYEFAPGNGTKYNLK